MKNETPDNVLDLEPNSKPYLLKRIISDGFDTVVIFLLFMILSVAVFNTPVSQTYNRHYGRCIEIENEAAEQFGDDADAIKAALRDNKEYQDEKFAVNIHGYLLMLIAGFIAEAAVLLVFPLIAPYRATPGKMMTKIVPFSPKKQTMIARPVLIARFAFVFILDSAFIYLYAGRFTFLIVPVIRLTELLLSKKNKTICDFLTGTMMVEQMSYAGIENN